MMEEKRGCCVRVLVVRSQCPRSFLDSKRKRKSVLLNVILFTTFFTYSDVFVTLVLVTMMGCDDLLVLDMVNFYPTSYEQ